MGDFMEKNILKLIFLVLCVILMIFTVTNVYAQDLESVKNKAKVDIPDSDTATNEGNKILGTVKAFGIVLSVVALMYLGIKYMLASTEERADMKKSIPYYITGVVFVGATLVIMQIIDTFVNELD